MQGPLSVIVIAAGLVLAALSIFFIWFNLDEKYKWGGVIEVVCNMASMLLFASVSSLPLIFTCIMVAFAVFFTGYEVQKAVRQ